MKPTPKPTPHGQRRIGHHIIVLLQGTPKTKHEPKRRILTKTERGKT